MSSTRKTIPPDNQPVKNLITGTDIQGKKYTLHQTTPYQMSLFQFFVPQEDKYSNSIELYDVIPKYYGNVRGMAAMRRKLDIGEFLPLIERTFIHRGQEYHLEIKAGWIKKENRIIEFYPTERELLVEEALRKVACDALKGCYFNDQAGVQFTLCELMRELKNRGHAIKYPALIEALTICNTTTLTVKSADGTRVMSSPIFPVLLMVNRAKWQENPKEAYCYVQFNPLVTQSIQCLTYRQFDYIRFMEFRQFLTRWLYKRLSHHFINAGLDQTYTILASTIIRDSGLSNYGRMRDTVRAINESINELKTKRILLKFEQEIHLHGKSVRDAKYILTPFMPFIEEMKKANKRQREILGEALENKKLMISYDDKGEQRYKITS